MDLRQIAPLFLVALTAGYVFSQSFALTKWGASRSEGQRLLFQSAFWGFMLTAFSWLCSLLASNFNAHKLALFLLQGVPAVPGLGLFLGALSWGIILPPVLNLVIDRDWASKRVIRKYGTELEKLMVNSQERGLPIMLTLSNGKVYIGWSIDPPDLSPNNDYIRILPSVSGYREQGTHAVNFTTHYMEVYDQIAEDMLDSFDAHDFVVVIRADEILHASLYSNLVSTGIFNQGYVRPEQNEPEQDRLEQED